MYIVMLLLYIFVRLGSSSWNKHFCIEVCAVLFLVFGINMLLVIFIHCIEVDWVKSGVHLVLTE
jgi:hypothetical protein